MTVDQGPSGKQLLFNYENREDVQLVSVPCSINGVIYLPTLSAPKIDEVGKCLISLCKVVPDGMVCFFASFTYLETVYKRWATAASGNILEELEKRKKVMKGYLVALHLCFNGSLIHIGFQGTSGKQQCGLYPKRLYTVYWFQKSKLGGLV